MGEAAPSTLTLPDAVHVMQFVTEEVKRMTDDMRFVRQRQTELGDSITGLHLRLADLDHSARVTDLNAQSLAAFNHAITRLVEVHLPELQREVEAQIEALARTTDDQREENEERDARIGQVNARIDGILKAMGDHAVEHAKDKEAATITIETIRQQTALKQEDVRGKWATLSLVVGGLITLLNVLITIANNAPAPP